MKSKMILFILSVVSSSIFAQNVEVPDKVKKEFSKLYPNAAEVKLSPEGDEEFEAEFIQNGKAISVVIHEDGRLLETESKIQIKDLPPAVEWYIRNNYEDFSITEAAKIIDSEGIITFEAEISNGTDKKDLFFNNDGKTNKKMDKQKTEETEEEEDEDKD